MRTRQRWVIFVVTILFFADCKLGIAADEYIGSQFSDGEVFSEVAVQDHMFIIPFPNVHAPFSTGHIESWLLRWKIASLKTNQPNRPDQVIYLARQQRTGEILDGFRASASTNFVVCNPANAVELWEINSKKPAKLLKSLPADDPATTPPPARLFSRSEKYFFIWKPTPAVYSVSNLSMVKPIKETANFKNFEADLHKLGGWQYTLTDDLKYLLNVPLDFDTQSQVDYIDTVHCYNLETDEYSIQKIRAGTNQATIVSAESIGGIPYFIAFWDVNGAKHLGIVDRSAQLVTELPTQGTSDIQFWRETEWDYLHGKFMVRERGGKLTIYDYRANQTQHFSLAHVALKSP